MAYKSLGVSGLEASDGKRIAFYHVMEGTPHERYSDESPGILQFIAYLERMGHTVDYFINLQSLREGMAAKNNKKQRYDVVAISAAEPDLKYVYTNAVEIKAIDPGVIVAVGGYVTAGVGKFLVQHPAIDAAFEGEADYTFPLFLKEARRAEDGSELAVPIEKFYRVKETGSFPFNTYYKSPIDNDTASKIIGSSFQRNTENGIVSVPMNNVYIKTDGAVFFNPSRNKAAQYDTAPLFEELGSLLNMPWWTTYSRHQSESMSRDVYSTEGSWLEWKDTGIYTSRGCRGKCNFCSINYDTRYPDPDAVIELVENTVKTFEHQTHKPRPRRVRFSDDSLTQNRKWALEILGKLDETGLSPLLGFTMQCRVVDGLKGGKPDSELLDALARTHFKQWVGVETLNPMSAEYLGKVPSGKGEKYVEMAEEYILASLERNVPTTAYAITVNPESTIGTIADDYLAWSALARKAYEETGRVFGINANQALIPVLGSALTQREIGDDSWEMPLDTVTRKRIGKVVGSFYPIVPLPAHKKGIAGKISRLAGREQTSVGMFNPEYYVLSPEVRRFLDVLCQRTQDTEYSRPSYFLDYIMDVGMLLQAYADATGDNATKAKARDIINNMAPVLNDERGYIEESIKRADELVADAFYGGKLGTKKDGFYFEEIKEGVERRFQDPHAKLGEESGLERVMDEIASRSPMLEEYAKTRTGFTKDGFFNSVMLGYYNLLMRYGYNLKEDDSTARLHKIRDAISELEHASNVSSTFARTRIQHISGEIKNYLLSAEKARELYATGFPTIWPSGVCIEDPKTGIRTFI